MANNITSARLGDVIGVYRGSIKHYGVYINEESVVHYAYVADEFSKNRYIHKTTFDRFLRSQSSYFICVFPKTYGKTSRINVAAAYEALLPPPRLLKLLKTFAKSRDWQIYSPQETVQRALSRVDEHDYSLSTSSCEHFVIWCKTGISESNQVKAILELLPTTTVNLPVAIK
ncbi:MAG: lecithin retinol acyltransferase family protein [Syntrophomonadaceae bacterium]|jgi:hypothetical protein